MNRELQGKNIKNESPLLSKEGSGVVTVLVVMLQSKKLDRICSSTTPKSLAQVKRGTSPGRDCEIMPRPEGIQWEKHGKKLMDFILNSH